MGVYFGIEEVGGVSQVENAPVGTLDDDELRDEAVEGYAEACDIARQIEDDAVEQTRPVDWLGRAKSARRHILRRVDACRVEFLARGLAEPLPEYAATLSIEVERLKKRANAEARALEIKAKRREEELLAATRRRERSAFAAERQAELDREKAAKRELHEQQAQEVKDRRELRRQAHDAFVAAEIELKKARPGLFYAAACECLTYDERTRVWAKAREMHPDHPAFAERERQP